MYETSITSDKVIFKWTEIEQKSFEEIKHIVTCDTLLAYTDLNKIFDIHTDDRYYQLGEVISQDGKSISLYRCKIIGTQIGYTITEK